MHQLPIRRLRPREKEGLAQGHMGCLKRSEARPFLLSGRLYLVHSRAFRNGAKKVGSLAWFNVTALASLQLPHKCSKDK